MKTQETLGTADQGNLLSSSSEEQQDTDTNNDGDFCEPEQLSLPEKD